MKILQVNKFNYGHGGADHYFLDLCNDLQERGHTVARFCMRDPKNEESQWSSYFVSQVDYKNGSLWNKLVGIFRIFYSFEARVKFARLCDDFSPDIIHIHNIYHQISPSILFVARKRNIPVIMHLHDYKILCPNYDLYTSKGIYTNCLGGKYYRCIRDKCFKESYFQSILVTMEMYLHHTIFNMYGGTIAAFIAPSQFMASFVSQHRPDLSERIRTITYGVRVPTTRKTPQFPKGDLYFVTYGYFHEQKGFDIPIKALASVSMPVKLLVIGSGEDKERLKDIAEEYDVQDRVIFTGRLSGEALQSKIAGAIAVIVPSRWYEVFGLVIIESFTQRKPVLGAKIGAIKELITDDVNSSLFEVDDVDGLASKMRFMLQNPALVERLASNALKTVIEDHDLQVHIDKIVSIYEEYISTK